MLSTILKMQIEFVTYMESLKPDIKVENGVECGSDESKHLSEEYDQTISKPICDNNSSNTNIFYNGCVNIEERLQEEQYEMDVDMFNGETIIEVMSDNSCPQLTNGESNVEYE